MIRIFFIFLLGLALFSCESKYSEKLIIKGLKEPVEILRDEWGVNHIYAKNQHDLFFAQGYAAAKDRLFQFEIWRRQATGTVSEILGERELKRDIGTRLFKFRGNMIDEMNHYHPDGVEIITAYTDGVNAYIEEILKNPENLPIEFKMLNIIPEKWTPEVVISRHQGLLGNIEEEIQYGRAVAALGSETVKDLCWFHPKDPNIELDATINRNLLFDDILELYKAYRTKVIFQETDVLPEYKNTKNAEIILENKNFSEDKHSIGSNNWVASSDIMADGNTYMANDPHRRIAVPSLRYITHLVAPGWNVIGGGEPEIPGISIGHNEFGAWGLTVFETDGEDLLVYDLNPKNLKQYRYKDKWMDVNIISEKISVKDRQDVIVDLWYTHHGPVCYVDSVNYKAYAVRCAWQETGSSPYLTSLRMNQAKTWEEFREACNYSHIPGENMIWTDKKGNIGWQAVGIAPIRRNFSGLVPVPGDGRYEWDGYLPIIQKPNALNPDVGFISTANENVTPVDYEQRDAIGYTWADPYRGERITEILSSGKKLTMKDLEDLQTDYLSIPARTLVPYLTNLKLEGESEKARKILNEWDFKLEASSIEAAIYVAWEDQLKLLAKNKFIPEAGKQFITSIQLIKIIDWISNPDKRFGENPIEDRNLFLTEAFENGIEYLKETLGDNMDNWQYGQAKFKHSYMEHALGGIVKEEYRSIFNLGPLPRGGNGYTVGSTGSNYRQSSGASFRIIVNTGDWDAAIASNPPGQSGNPESEFYGNLFESWSQNQYFPLYYSRNKIDSVTVNNTLLKPDSK